MLFRMIPTTIFTGFLGSGKTTIISKLIDELQTNGKQVIYIKNEIGSENIDAEIMKGKHIATRELLNGCICCTLVGPFIAAIDEISEKFKPDRIIIEASGAADPSAIALMIQNHPKLVRDGVISIVDTTQFEGYKDLSITAKNQAKFTDLIVFNKIELSSLEQKKRVVGYVRELNDHSPIIEAPEGVLDPTLAFGVSSKELEELLEIKQDHSHHLTQDGLESFHLKSKGEIEKQALSDWISQLPKSVFRIKGMVNLKGEGLNILNTVGARTTYVQAENEQKNMENSIVFIGFHINDLAPEIEQQFMQLFP
ncbi:MAG: hypothetical protein COY80_02135 [Candidatus Pacebacteria bacterium CG_4_10_14_0_8_um_filter_42_14]|nr:MAG: hypothetical protein COY80_02135 [Candidatus Pacebacteria bacterium CG_4_10_14_0_8_um_filter_42_14]